MTTATQSRTTRKARQVFRSTRYGDHELRYYVCTRTGRHVVVSEPCNDHPNYYRHDTVEGARATWSRLCARLLSQEYAKLA